MRHGRDNMIDIDRIEKYILGGKWENQYPQAIEELLAEVKRLRKELKRIFARYNQLTEHWEDEDWWNVVWCEEGK